MLKKLVLMFALVCTAGAGAVVHQSDGQVSAAEPKTSVAATSQVSKPGMFKKAYNFCWAKRSGWTKVGITATFLPSLIILGSIGKDCIGKRKIEYDDIKDLICLIPIISHIALYRQLFYY